MSPPIRDGSGSSIGSIRLGDGSEISEVRTGAGDVLFSGNAIPDSGLLHEWPIDSGSGTVVADEIGSQDGNAQGVSWTPNAKVGDFALTLDGSSNNWVDYGFDTSFSQGTFLFWFKYESGTDSPLFGNGGTGEQSRSVLETPSELSSKVTYNRQSSDQSVTVISSNEASRGEWNMMAAWWDDSIGEIRIYLNGNREGTKSYTGGLPGSSDGWRFGRQTRNASAENRFVGDYDYTSFYDRPLSDSEVEQWFNALR